MIQIHFTIILSFVLLSGEIMQLFIDDDPKKRFNDYIDKTYRKTASLMANSCKAVHSFMFCWIFQIVYCFFYI